MKASRPFWAVGLFLALISNGLATDSSPAGEWNSPMTYQYFTQVEGQHPEVLFADSLPAKVKAGSANDGITSSATYDSATWGAQSVTFADPGGGAPPTNSSWPNTNFTPFSPAYNTTPTLSFAGQTGTGSAKTFAAFYHEDYLNGSLALYGDVARTIFPADPSICVGSGIVVVVANAMIKAWNKTSGEVVMQRTLLPTFFGITYITGGEVSYYDPSCHFDPATNRFFVVTAARVATNQTAYLVVAVNSVQDSIASWSFSWINVTQECGGFTNRARCPAFDDYPQIGMNNDVVAISTIVYGFGNATVVGVMASGRAWIISKNSLLQGGQYNCSFGSTNNTLKLTSFWALSYGGWYSLRFGLQPPSEGGYTDFGGAIFGVMNIPTAQQLAVTAVYNTSTIDDPVPNLSMVRLTSAVNLQWVNRAPADATQTSQTRGECTPLPTPMAINPLYGGDGRVGQSAYANGIFHTVYSMAPVGTTRNSIRYVAFQPMLFWNTTTQVLVNISLTADIGLSDQGHSFLFPVVAVTKSGLGGIAFSFLSPNITTTMPSTGMILFNATSYLFDRNPYFVLGTGAAPYYGLKRSGKTYTRWGDYSGIAIEDESTIWGTSMCVPQRVGTIGCCTNCLSYNWGICAGSVTQLAPITPTPTPTPTQTFTRSATSTASPTPSSTATITPTASDTPTSTNTPTSSPTSSPSNTPTPCPSPTYYQAPTPTPTTTATITPTQTATPTITPTQTCTPTPTNTPSSTPTSTSTPTRSATAYITCTFGTEKTPTAAECISSEFVIDNIIWAGYGLFGAECPSPTPTATPTCQLDTATAIDKVTIACLNRMNCSLPINNAAWGGDPCPGFNKRYGTIFMCVPKWATRTPTPTTTPTRTMTPTPSCLQPPTSTQYISTVNGVTTRLIGIDTTPSNGWLSSSSGPVLIASGYDGFTWGTNPGGEVLCPGILSSMNSTSTEWVSYPCVGIVGNVDYRFTMRFTDSTRFNLSSVQMKFYSGCSSQQSKILTVSGFVSNGSNWVTVCSEDSPALTGCWTKFMPSAGQCAGQQLEMVQFSSSCSSNDVDTDFFIDDITIVYNSSTPTPTRSPTPSPT